MGALLSISARGQEPRQAPSFRSSVEVASVDASVVDNRGRPVLGLTAGDFVVRVDGSPRKVLSAEWVSLKTPEGPLPAAAPDGYSNNESAGGRLIVVAVDQPNIAFGAAAAVSSALATFFDGLAPTDRVAAVALDPGGLATPFTTDRGRVKQAIGRMNGRDHKPGVAGFYSVALSEALSIADGQTSTLEDVVSRECNGQNSSDALRCRSEIQSDAQAIARDAEISGASRRLPSGAAR